MNTPIVTQSSINTQSVAFQFGVTDATRGESCVPEMIFLQRQQQVEYAAGWESIKGVTATTAQFTGSELPKPVQLAHKCRGDGGEYVRYTDMAADKILRANEARQRRLERMSEMTAEFMGGIYGGDILFMAV